eukprot:TRINITY_DN117_c0_g1_i1.p1 TRINITY_DN117_c0_g1~~TRINITY_DN117_c0_g1_i1.p1  ORF type:complete len:305 (-),score=122.16 TRINITY_DN117_c0_g1_i1:31-864(-)
MDQEQFGKELGGFSFEFTKRNEMMESAGLKLPRATKTGTTIAGLIFKDGVVLGADTRATMGPIVSDKNCEKIHYIAENIWCCGAGTAADTEKTTDLISSNLELHRLATGRQPRVVTALTMLKRMLFRYQGHISAALVLGGVDITGPSLYTVYPHGSTDRLPYVTMGSGSLAAMAIMEAHYKPGLEKEEAVKLMVASISAGVFNDLGSGGNVDIVVLTKDGKEVRRNFVKPNPRLFRSPKGYTLEKGTTAVLKETFVPFEKPQVVVVEETMEITKEGN